MSGILMDGDKEISVDLGVETEIFVGLLNLGNILK